MSRGLEYLTDDLDEVDNFQKIRRSNKETARQEDEKRRKESQLRKEALERSRQKHGG